MQQDARVPQVPRYRPRGPASRPYGSARTVLPEVLAPPMHTEIAAALVTTVEEPVTDVYDDR